MPVPLYLLAVAVFAMGTSEFMLAGLVPDIAAAFGVSVGTAGLLTSAFAVGMVVGAPLMAVSARRWPARTTLLFFVLLFAATHIVGALTTNFAVLLGSRVIAALADAGFLAVALGAAAALAPADRTGRALAVLLSGTTAATIAGAPGGALLGTLLGYRSTFWAIALLCLPAALGIAAGIPAVATASGAGVPLRREIAELARPALVLVIVLAALVNAATFAAFTFLAPIVTETAGLGEFWVPVALMLFGVGSFAGVTVAGRFSDRRPGALLAVCGPACLLGWVALALVAGHPAALLFLVFTQGVLAFALGGTLITRVLYEAGGAPSMRGSYATAALNLGAAGGPALAALTLGTGAGNLGPVWLSSLLIALALAVRYGTMNFAVSGRLD
ncbi:MFS transporter [Nocardia sp. 2]|uniref:MFS transporter n=1 Tax=Nocardia acididurans TaxID=2802282 RepID=A0ABS1LXB1_9NOCA|nr:Cmx/CmrA family chloramphenicol efflux MFS transporter [Nocardia acididurans]MBL1072821.1 MFS transporter [Nocardia acididurans]